jgi:hypothetical protein
MRVGGREVIESGSVITHKGDDTVELSHGQLSIKLIFNAAGEGEPKMRAEGEGQVPTLYLTNWDNPLGLAWYSQRVGWVSAEGA